MKALIVGYGSMGRRRIRIIRKLYSEAEIICVDSNTERTAQAEKDGCVTYTNLKEAISTQPDCAFVCTSPGRHSVIILELLKANIDTFTELNLVDTDYEEMIELCKKTGVKLFMSSTMIYDKQIITIKELLNRSNEPVSYMYHVGQYLPDWHPWESYLDFFISKRETNGCREILAIQLPWLIDVFGEVEQINSMCVKNSKLEVDYNDTYYLQIKHKNGVIGSFVCDVVSRKATNSFELIGEHIHLKWDGTPEGMFLYDYDKKEQKKIETYKHAERMEGYADNIIEDEYMDEVKAFFDYIYEDKLPEYNLEKDKYVLSIINEIEGEK